MRFRGRTLLAFWLTVVLTGTAVSHRHAAAAGHTHGFGWAALRGNSAPSDLPLAHRHFVLLGVEFGAVPAHADCGSCDGTRSAAGEVAPGEARGVDLTPEPPALVPNDPTHHPTCVGPDRLTPASLPSDCPHLSHARTGVLRS